MNQTKLDAALANAARGFSVFPLIPNDKRPLYPNWQNDATTDPAKIHAWWDEEPQANIGISTGTLVVPDIDRWKGGTEAFAALTLINDFPKTLISKTVRDGYHMIYRLPEHVIVKGGVDKLGKGIDVKAYGGYVVGAGSTIDGKAYRWANELPIALAPQWLIDQCKAPRVRTAAAGTRVAPADDSALRAATDWLRSSAPHAETGNRGFTAYKVACQLYDRGVDQATCTELLTAWSADYCFPSMDQADIEHAARSSWNYRENAVGNRHPGNASGFKPVTITERAVVTTTLIDSSNGLEWFADAARRALTHVGRPLIEGVWECGSFIVTYGESGGGKSFMGLDQGYSVATGRAWLGKHKVKQGSVLYLALEGGQGINARLEALRQRYPDDKDVPLFVVKASLDLLRNHAHGQQVVTWAAEAEALSGFKCELIIIDTLSRALAGGDENSPTDMGAYVGVVDRIREATGSAVNTIHHTGKDKSKGARGHSLLRAAADTEVEVNDKRMTVRKQREGAEIAPISFRLVPRTIGLDPEKRVVTSCIFEATTHKEWIMARTPEQQVVLDKIHAFTKSVVNTDFMLADIMGAAPTESGAWEEAEKEECRRKLNALITVGWISKNPRQHGYKLLLPRSHDLPQTPTNDPVPSPTHSPSL